MAPRAFEMVFFSLSPRLYTLRSLVISSLLIISVNLEGSPGWPISLRNPGLWVSLYAFIAIHQIISTFKWPIIYGVIEFPILIAEVVGTGHYAKMVPLQSWMPETLVFHAVLAWIVVATLSLTICFRIAEVVYSKGQSLIMPFDILAYESNFPQSNTLKKEWKSTFYMLFGRSIWKKNFVGETMSIRVFRGILAIIVLSAVFFYTLLNVVFAPIKETALSPVKTYRISGITPSDLYRDIKPPAWCVTCVLEVQDAFQNLYWQNVFFSSVTVTAIWNNDPVANSTSDSGVQTANSSSPECQPQTMQSGNISYFLYWCSSTAVQNVLVLPDLKINVNFTGLSSIAQFYKRPQLPLIIGLSDSPEDDYTHTIPVTIIPGVNMAAPYIVGIRQIYTNGILAGLGIFEATKTFLLPQIVAFYPDPTSTFIGKNLSSLNIFLQGNYGETTFTQDYREKSVVSGFSSVGGLWTAFSGIFAILFGASMLHIFYGSKPLSIFGVAHKFQVEEMKKDCLARYPQILKENCSPGNRGLLSLLRDHLINLDFLDDEEDNYSISEDWDKEADTEISLFPASQAPAQRYINIPQ